MFGSGILGFKVGSGDLLCLYYSMFGPGLFGVVYVCTFSGFLLSKGLVSLCFKGIYGLGCLFQGSFMPVLDGLLLRLLWVLFCCCEDVLNLRGGQGRLTKCF